MRGSFVLRLILAFLIGVQTPVAHTNPGQFYIPRYDIRVYDWDTLGIPYSFYVNHGTLEPPRGWVILTDSATGKHYVADYKGLRKNPDDGSTYMQFDNITPVPEGQGGGGIPNVQPGTTAENQTLPGLNLGDPESSSAEPPLDKPRSPHPAAEEPGFWGSMGAAARGAVAAGLTAGVVNEIVNRWIITNSQRADWAAAQSASNFQNSLAQHQSGLVSLAEGRLEVLERELFKTDGLQPQTDLPPHVFQTTDPKLLKDLTDIQNKLIYSPSLHPDHQKLRGLGLGLVEQSDLASVAGESATAEAFEEYAKLTADLLVGFDPVTGAARSIYEAFTGENLITGVELSEFERGAAIFGAVTFGFGQKVTKGISAVVGATKAMGTRLKFVKDIATNNSWVKAMQSGALRFDPKSLGQFERFQSMIRSEQGLSEVSRPFHRLSQDVLDQNPSQLFHYSDLAFETRNLKVPVKYGMDATQELSPRALDAYDSLKKGDQVLVRQGVRGESRVAMGGGKPQYWALDETGVGTPGFADRMGAYTQTPDFVEYAKLKEGSKYVVRSAPPGVLPDGRITPGGGLEVVVESGGVNPIDFKVLPR